MNECKHIKDRECEPTSCLLQSAAAEVASEEFINTVDNTDASYEEEAVSLVVSDLAGNFKKCAMEILAENNPWIKEKYEYNLELVVEANTPQEEKANLK
jgi:hypothetical protein